MSLEDDLESDGDSDSEDDDTLTKRQHAIIEFFIAKLRLCSQKNMRHWALAMPLTCHSHSHVALPPSHPLHGASWSWNVLWNTLNEVFDRLVPAHHDNVWQQYTVLMAFGNWQQMLKKTWQTNGYSSNYLKGVASFIRRTGKDKATTMIPTGSVIRSPSGIVFKTMSYRFLDAYLTVVSGELQTRI